MNGSWGLCFGAFAVSLGYGMLTPFVNELMSGTQSSVRIGLLIGVYPLAKAMGYAACLSPKIRSWPAALMLFLTVISYAVLSFTLEPFAVGMARCLEGFVFGWFLAKASVDIASKGEAVGYRLSWLNGMSSAGVLAGPLIIAGTNAFHRPQGAFLIVAILCGITVLFQRQKSVKSEASEIVPPVSVLKQLLPVWPLVALFALFDCTFGALSLGVPVAFQALGDRAISATAIFFSGGFLIFTVVMPIFGYLTDRLQPLFVLVPALALITALFCLAGIVSEPFQVGGILSLEYVAAAAAYSSALAVIGKLAPNALPLIGIGQSLAMSVGSLMAGIIIETNGVPHVFVFLCFFYLAVLGLILTSAKKFLVGV
ncbi:MFS transporter [Rahnella sp. L72c]|uniref:MFS transporter n=1 Tax=Rahnella perminowiae TaxID=2816244 RepID=A0ABS6KW48_9GAMM|nr:MFS transporter [Rahnella perminowiae]MBU9833569.1 MFS transporter [Rahnella perminowiae]